MAATGSQPGCHRITVYHLSASWRGWGGGGGGGGAVTCGCLKHENENDLIFTFSKIDCKAIFESNLATYAPEKLC